MSPERAASPVDASLVSEQKIGRLAVLGAWCLLVAVDVVLRTAGFSRLCAIVRWWPTARPRREANTDRILACCAAVDRARTYYFKYAWCLQASATAVCLLRAHGIRAELVIGVRKFPFYAHAWVEVDRHTVMDNGARLSTLCTAIERC